MKKTIVYKTADRCEVKGDFYAIDKQQAPVLIYIHGGGLIWGSRTDIPEEQAAFFNKAGFHVFSIDYRLAPETKLADISKDIEDAIIWLEEDGRKEFDYDANRIAVIGSSAGGFLALMAGLFNRKPKAIVSLYGYGDITGSWYSEPSPFFLEKPSVPKALARKLIAPGVISESPIEKRYAIYLYCRQQGAWLEEATGLDVSRQLEEIKQFCPVDQAKGDYPPALLVHGDADTDVPYEESVKMADKLHDLKVGHRLITIKGGDHVFDQNWQDPAVSKAFADICAFLDEQLG